MQVIAIDPGDKTMGFCRGEDGIPLEMWVEKVGNSDTQFLDVVNATHKAIQRFPNTDLVIIEGFRGRGVMPQLIGAIKYYLELNGIEKYEVLPNEVKKGLTGKGDASKTQIINKVNEMFKTGFKYSSKKGDPHEDDKHMADACAIWHIGLLKFYEEQQRLSKQSND